MTKQLIERIEIVDQFKSIYFWQKDSVAKQYNRVKWLGISKLVFGVLLLLYLIDVSAMAVLKMETDLLGWEKSALLVFVVMAANVYNPYLFIEFLLKKHLRKIRNINGEFNETLNTDLRLAVVKLNSKSRRLYITEIPAILVMIGAIFQSQGLNPYWYLFAYFIPLFGMFMLIKMYSDVSMIRRILIHFEKVNL